MNSKWFCIPADFVHAKYHHAGDIVGQVKVRRGRPAQMDSA
jgi:hypothetical protein